MKKTTSIFLLIVIVLTFITSCNSSGSVSSNPNSNAPAEKTTIRLTGIKGPTGIGMVRLMELNEKNETDNKYEITLSASPDEIVGKVSSGAVDIAAVPTNLAANLYAKTQKKVKIIALNTMGMLRILAKDGSGISSAADLKGKTITLFGKGSTPEYILNYILTKNNLTPGKDVTLNFVTSEHSEVATLALAGQADIVLVPEPFATQIISKNAEFKSVIDLSGEWNKLSVGEFSMGCLIVRTEFLENNKAAVDKFLDEYKASIDFVNTNVDEGAQLCAKYEIIANADMAKKAIPNCSIVYVDGDEMKTKTRPYYQILFEADPKAVGGSVPDEGLYYKK